MTNWDNRDYLSFFLVGVISAVGLPLGDLLSLKAGGELLLWLILLSTAVYLKNPNAIRIALPLSILILTINLYPSIAGSPLFTGTQLVYFVAMLFSPIYFIFPPLFPLLLLAISFFQRDKDVDFALKAVAMSHIGLSTIMAIYWHYVASMTYPDYVIMGD